MYKADYRTIGVLCISNGSSYITFYFVLYLACITVKINLMIEMGMSGVLNFPNGALPAYGQPYSLDMTLIMTLCYRNKHGTRETHLAFTEANKALIYYHYVLALKTLGL